MRYQGTKIHNKYYRGLIPGIILAVVLPLFLGTFSSVLASSGDPGNMTEGKKVTGAEDTTKTPSGHLPLAQNSGGLKRPRFETARLMIGIGGMFSNLSDLERLGVNKSNLTVPFSIYAYVPFQRDHPSLYFIGGWDIGGNPSFKALFLYQFRFKLIVGLGGGKTWYSYDGDDVIIDSSQNHALLALGVNLSPQRVDLLLTVPLAPSLSTNFEGEEYSIRPAGIQISLLISL